MYMWVPVFIPVPAAIAEDTLIYHSCPEDDKAISHLPQEVNQLLTAIPLLLLDKKVAVQLTQHYQAKHVATPNQATPDIATDQPIQFILCVGSNQEGRDLARWIIDKRFKQFIGEKPTETYQKDSATASGKRNGREYSITFFYDTLEAYVKPKAGDECYLIDLKQNKIVLKNLETHDALFNKDSNEMDAENTDQDTDTQSGMHENAVIIDSDEAQEEDDDIADEGAIQNEDGMKDNRAVEDNDYIEQETEKDDVIKDEDKKEQETEKDESIEQPSTAAVHATTEKAPAQPAIPLKIKTNTEKKPSTSKPTAPQKTWLKGKPYKIAQTYQRIEAEPKEAEQPATSFTEYHPLYLFRGLFKSTQPHPTGLRLRQLLDQAAENPTEHSASAHKIMSLDNLIWQEPATIILDNPAFKGAASVAALETKLSTIALSKMQALYHKKYKQRNPEAYPAPHQRLIGSSQSPDIIVNIERERAETSYVAMLFALTFYTCLVISVINNQLEKKGKLLSNIATFIVYSCCALYITLHAMMRIRSFIDNDKFSLSDAWDEQMRALTQTKHHTKPDERFIELATCLLIMQSIKGHEVLPGSGKPEINKTHQFMVDFCSAIDGNYLISAKFSGAMFIPKNTAPHLDATIQMLVALQAMHGKALWALIEQNAVPEIALTTHSSEQAFDLISSKALDIKNTDNYLQMTRAKQEFIAEAANTLFLALTLHKTPKSHPELKQFAQTHAEFMQYVAPRIKNDSSESFIIRSKQFSFVLKHHPELAQKTLSNIIKADWKPQPTAPTSSTLKLKHH